MSQQNDTEIQRLFDIVQDKKREIAIAEKPSWKTNCSFRNSKENAGNSTNIQIIVDIEELISILSFLMEKEYFFNKAAEEIGVKNKFKWLGFTLEDWKQDIKTRISKIEISKKKKELEEYEERLNKVLSPELRQKLEIEAISKGLGSL